MKVKDRLTSTRANIEDGAVSLLDLALARDHGGGHVAAADDFGVGVLRFFQSCKMPFGNDEDVRRRLGIDVFEGKNVLIFEHLL